MSLHVPHGTSCDCLLLGAAVGPRISIPFSFCQSVLQRRWTMTCKHGEVQAPQPAAAASKKWSDEGEMTPLRAILVKNT